MFGRKKRKEKEAERIKHQQELRKGLLFWLPGGSSRLDIYLDYCIIRCLGKTKMEEKERKIPFTSITNVVFTPPHNMANGSLQLFTKEMPDVKRNYWYAYENNLIVVHPSTLDLAKKVQEYILNPSAVTIPPEYLSDLKKEARQAKREEAEKAAQAEEEAKQARHLEKQEVQETCGEEKTE